MIFIHSAITGNKTFQSQVSIHFPATHKCQSVGLLVGWLAVWLDGELGGWSGGQTDGFF